jgi:hypothetical protein
LRPVGEDSARCNTSKSAVACLASTGGAGTEFLNREAGAVLNGVTDRGKKLN